MEKPIVEKIVFAEESFALTGACFDVHNELGAGFLELVYHEALAIEFGLRRIPFIREPRLELMYKGRQLQQFYQPDFLCFSKIIVEVNAVDRLADAHRAQVLNYLKATGFHLGFLVNFCSHPKLEYQRIVL